ncbi:hypothetical protein [Diaphorobacter sp. JS3051]|uniref:hypothetical protein n=1 Tax=Diaphorobacter sp. JS3051 TaxID=2792224 RepID=UPI0018CB9713|nr:hypothetical protein [Diaphorobacter sp. JS3051]QPN32545.1 hypothetical protein I3K84_08140 [Diaphorobacter sp. JS3051]
MRSFIVALTAVAACTVSAQTATKKPAARSAAAAPVVAPEPPAHVWDKEPEAFLGIKFNEPLNVQKCPSRTVGQYVKTEFLDHEAMKSVEGVCVDATDPRNKYQKPENGTFKLDNLPSLGIGYAASVHTNGGVVSKITIDLNQSAFSVLLTAFKDRYGLPSVVESNTVKTNAGAEFNAADVSWKGKKLSIYMYERMSKVDESYVVISDNAIMEAELATQRARRAAEAQKF